MQCAGAQLGEEQVFDIALDRSTDLLHAEHDAVQPIGWEDDSVDDSVDRDAKIGGAEEESTELAGQSSSE